MTATLVVLAVLFLAAWLSDADYRWARKTVKK